MDLTKLNEQLEQARQFAKPDEDSRLLDSMRGLIASSTELGIARRRTDLLREAKKASKIKF